MIIDAAAGHVVTNQHVIGNADEITVRLHDGRSVQAEVIGSDPNADIAVIKIPAQGLTAIDLGDSDRLRVGDFVVAIGNPFGLATTVTLGIVSAKARDINQLYKRILETNLLHTVADFLLNNDDLRHVVRLSLIHI